MPAPTRLAPDGALVVPNSIADAAGKLAMDTATGRPKYYDVTAAAERIVANTAELGSVRRQFAEVTGSPAGSVSLDVSGGTEDGHLLIWCSARCNDAAVIVGQEVTINGDTTAANYIRHAHATGADGAHTVDAPALSDRNLGDIPGSGAPANRFGGDYIVIFNYRATDRHKTIWRVSSNPFSDTLNSGNIRSIVTGNAWKSTAAIDTVTFAPAAGSYVVGSQFLAVEFA